MQEQEGDVFSFEEWFDNNSEVIRSKITDEIIEHGLAGLPYEMLESPYVSHIENPGSIKVVEVYDLEENKEYISYQLTVDITVDLVIYRPDYYWMVERYPLVIDDADFDEKLVSAYINLTIPLEIAVTLNKTSNETEGFELSIPEFYGLCNVCGAPILSDAAEECGNCGRRLF